MKIHYDNYVGFAIRAYSEQNPTVGTIIVVSDSSLIKRGYDASSIEIKDCIEGLEREKFIIYMLFTTEEKVFVEDSIFEEIVKEMVFIIKESQSRIF